MNIAQLTAKLADPSNVCLMVLAGSIGFLLLRTQKALARQRTSSLPAPLAASDIGSSSDVSERWELEMHEKARAFSAQIDTKLALLQTLIAGTHEAAARLEAALDREEELHSTASGESDTSGLALDQLKIADFPMDSTPSTSDRREEIYTLADYGFDIGEISRRTARPRGEVELVLSLRAA